MRHFLCGNLLFEVDKLLRLRVIGPWWCTIFVWTIKAFTISIIKCSVTIILHWKVYILSENRIIIVILFSLLKDIIFPFLSLRPPIRTMFRSSWVYLCQLRTIFFRIKAKTSSIVCWIVSLFVESILRTRHSRKSYNLVNPKVDFAIWKTHFF